VVAFDVDRDAIWVARRTAIEQDWLARPLLFAGPIAAVGRYGFDVVLCNMITEHLRPLLPDIRRVLAPTGFAVLSGMLETELDDVCSDLRGAGFEVRDQRRSGEWLSLTVVRDDG